VETKYQNILVVKNRAMGDSVMGLSAISYMRDLYPNAKIYYALPNWILPLYKNILTDADEVIGFDLKSLKDWGKLWKICSSRNIDVVHEMHQAGRTAKFFKVYSLLKRIPYFFHNHHLKSGTDVLDQGVIKAVIQRDLDGVFSYFSNMDKVPNYLDYCPQMKMKNKLNKKSRLILGVVATRETKKWPLEYYFELAKIIKQAYPNIEIAIPLSKSKTDLNIKEKLLSYGIEEYAKVVHLSLDELPLYIAASKLYIGNDTGLKHLAIATNVKSYTLFGPEPPNEWHPYDSSTHPFFYKEGLDCRTREAHYCGLSTCDSMICLNQFSAKFIFEKVQKDLS